MKKGDYLKSIRRGNIHIENGFFSDENYEFLVNKIEKLNFIETYQPATEFYGNRFQAQPTWEYSGIENLHKNLKKEFVSNLENILDIKIKSCKTVIRKTITSEILKSKVNTKYGLIHRDSVGEDDFCDIAGVLYFTQSYDGGTAFFEKEFDKYPDIEISAYPNRLIMYDARRSHASCHDFTFNERYVLAFALKCL